MMSMRFADGTSTNKYDQETNTATLDRLDDLRDLVISNEDQIRQKVDRLENDLYIHIERNGSDFKKVSEDMNYTIGAINYTSILLAIIINSKLFRFLNFFGRWFVYDRNTSVYQYKLNDGSVNITYNQIYINRYEYYEYFISKNYKIPWLSRICYNKWFKKNQKKTRNE